MPVSSFSAGADGLRVGRNGLRRKRMTGPVRDGGGPPLSLWRKLKREMSQTCSGKVESGRELTGRRGNSGRRRI